MADVTSGRSASLRVTSRGDVARVRAMVREHADRMAFSTKQTEELVIVAAELAANLLNHGGGGQFTMMEKIENGRRGLVLETCDQGPGFPDIEVAMTDGVSSGTGLGYGMGSINRLMDSLEIESPTEQGRGTRVRCCRFVPTNGSVGLPCPLDTGVASRPCPGQKECGDGFIIKHMDNALLVGVIDGLGHGPFAHKATLKIHRYIMDHADQPFEYLFKGAGRAARGSRGGVMALVRLEWNGGPVTMTFASIGNIETRFMTSSSGHLPVRRGIIGKNAPDPVIVRQPFDPEDVLFLFSDGIASHWTGFDKEACRHDSAGKIAVDILKRFARDNDDATILVVKAKGFLHQGGS